MSEKDSYYSVSLETIYKEAIDAKPLESKVISSPTLDSGRPKVHVLVPNLLEEEEVRTEMERISHNYGKKEYLQELIKIFDEIGKEAVIHLLRMRDFPQIVDKIPKGETIMNLCDGSDIDGVPGPCVTKYLEEQGYMFCGCDYQFMEVTVSKFAMKQKFLEQGVSTAKFFLITKDTILTRECVAHMAYPLFVKASDSYGSIGLSQNSVCHNFEELESQVKYMRSLFHNVLIEEYIQGAEFSLLIIGDSRARTGSLEVFPAAQRIFDPSVPDKEQFLSYKLVWEEGGERYKYAVADRDNECLMDLAKRAYVCLNGTGFARVDVRRRDATNEYFVLEVNATCGVGYDSSSTQILKLGGKGVHYLMEKILELGVNHPKNK
jgi:D-alanine-D-alanine ligase-like ATP-grasp enzyme